jgi:hypothetical protein
LHFGSCARAKIGNLIPPPREYEVPIEVYKLVPRGKRGNYAVCKRGVKRVVLGELNSNKRGCEYRKRTVYGCRECDIPLCKEGPCFNKFHALEHE